jgi:tetratricopeptide (TPR) repeat protein
MKSDPTGITLVVDRGGTPPQGRKISAEEAERLLLERLKSRESDFLDVHWELACFYSKTGRQELAQTCLERYVANTNGPEKRAGCYLALGQLMEQMRDFESAIFFYSRAFAIEPENNGTWYLIHNNLGFCLNHFGRYSEVEGYCQNAIKIDPSRSNAFKNLGVSLAGQGDYARAAGSFIAATKANAADGRALKLLERLLAEHPEVETKMPDIEEQIQGCRRAVTAVAEIRRQTQRENSTENRK